MAKRSMKRQRVKIRRRPRFLAILVIVLIAGIGSYFVVASHAQGSIPPTLALNLAGGHYSLDAPSAPQPKVSGNNYKVPFYAASNGSTYLSAIKAAMPYQLDLGLTTANLLTPTGLTCTHIVPCYISRISVSTWTNAVNNWLQATGYPRKAGPMPLTIVCVNVNSQTLPLLDIEPGGGYTSPLFWLDLTASKQVIPESKAIGESPLEFVLWSTVVQQGMAPGSCQSNPTGSGLYAEESNLCPDGNYGNWTTPDCAGVVGAGEFCGFVNVASNCPDGGGSGDSFSSGKGPKGSGKGGGSSGSSVTRQSDAEKPVPKSSPAGTKKQAKPPTPSPFYDGKQYLPGSEADISQGAIHAAAHTAHHFWIYVVLAVAFAGAIGFTFRRRIISRLKRRKG